MFGGVPRLQGRLGVLAGPAVFRRLTTVSSTSTPAGQISSSSSSSFSSFSSFSSSSALLCGRRGYGGPTRALLGRRIKGRRSRHREAAEGDWLCQCGELNYKSKRECFKCGAPAPPLPPGVRRPSLPGEDPHDWACPCGQMNFRGSVVCHKCQQPKPAPPPLPGKEVTLWTCPKCKGVNRNVRKFCFKCSAPSPLLTFKPVV